VVEEAFAGIPARHPAVRRVLPIAWRRWRRGLYANRADLAQFRRELRERDYSLILDAQGLLKSAAVTLLARGRRKSGFDWASAREGAASLFYGSRHPVRRQQHAVDRLRQLFAAAIGYRMTDAEPRFAIGDSRNGKGDRAQRECVLLHGTTWTSKHWPEPMWTELARRLSERGFAVRLPWGNGEEQARAGRIAAGLPGVEVLDAMTIDTLIDRLSAAALAVGVDSGLSHLAAALGVPTLTLYGSTDATLTGARGARASNLQASFPCAPCLRRDCGYRGAAQHWQGRTVVPACYARLAPEEIWPAIERLVD
ncbi:MAG: lipopolysaccharide heptosyltransferase I, partial [Pseudomonadales bacterium]|nr:lipopolysaccharide heptosyltransferase I [Pseudomonadales bacterium]